MSTPSKAKAPSTEPAPPSEKPRVTYTPRPDGVTTDTPQPQAPQRAEQLGENRED